MALIYNMDNIKTQRIAISLKSLAVMLDAHRTSVRRWLKEAGIKPVSIGRGKNGAIRYRWNDIKQWLSNLEHID